MTKVGLGQRHSKMIEFKPLGILSDEQKHIFLYKSSHQFYNAFKSIFGDGYITVIASNTGNKFDAPNFDVLVAAFVNYHFAIEIMLKALLCLALGKKYNPEEYNNHELIKLIADVEKSYPCLAKITKNNETMLLLEELGNHCIPLRYGECSISLRPNKKNGWKDKKILQELSEVLKDIFSLLDATYKNQQA